MRAGDEAEKWRPVCTVADIFRHLVSSRQSMVAMPLNWQCLSLTLFILAMHTTIPIKRASSLGHPNDANVLAKTLKLTIPEKEIYARCCYKYLLSR